MHKFDRKLEIIEERISKVKVRSIESIQTEAHREKSTKKQFQLHMGQISQLNTYAESS